MGVNPIANKLYLIIGFGRVRVVYVLGYIHPPLPDLVQGLIACHPVTNKVTTDHGSCPPHAAPTMHINLSPIIQRCIYCVEDTCHCFVRRQASVLNGNASVCEIKIVLSRKFVQDQFIWLKFSRLGQVNEIGKASLKKRGYTLARDIFVIMTGILTGEELAGLYPIGFGDGSSEEHNIFGVRRLIIPIGDQTSVFGQIQETLESNIIDTPRKDYSRFHSVTAQARDKRKRTKFSVQRSYSRQTWS